MSVENAKQLLELLLEAGVHYGHQTKRWNPLMRDFILETRNSTHILDLSKTVDQLERAGNYLANLVESNGKILFIGCKKQAQLAVSDAAKACGQFYVNQRWLGGTLTNLVTIRQSVGKFKDFERKEKNAELTKLKKSEISMLRRKANRVKNNLEGILEMERVPDALFIVDTNKENIAVTEGKKLGIPIVAIVDSNSNPHSIDYPIAGNDDAVRSIQIILKLISDKIIEKINQKVENVVLTEEKYS